MKYKKIRSVLNESFYIYQMDENNTILDDESDKRIQEIIGISSFYDRIRHFAVDGIIILIIYTAIKDVILHGYLEYKHVNWIGLGLIIYFIYYVSLEFFFGITIGKLMNKTKVLNKEYEIPNFKEVIIRTVIRLIPFEIFTILSATGQPLHDMLSKTWVVYIKR